VNIHDFSLCRYRIFASTPSLLRRMVETVHARLRARAGKGCRATLKEAIDMKAKILLPLIAAAFFSLSAHAHDCSGGAGGGMDATGNQCNDAAAVATTASFDAVAPSSDRLQKVDLNKTASCDKCAVKRTASTRQGTARQRNKHG
jgi:hypothetical protein